MKIKQKVFSGIGLLFLMIALLTIVSITFVHKLSNETKNILVANYNTLDYSRNMLMSLNNGIVQPKEQKIFELNLKKQQANITEIGEYELTNKLANDFNDLKSDFKNETIIKTIRNDISDIMLLNMQAIQRKSNIATHTADNSILWISFIGVLCFVFAFVLLVNLPSNIADPIKELSESIKEIAAENYNQRVHFEKHNEFGDLARSFNTMAQKLEEYKAGNIEKLLIEKKRIETLINNMNEPVIGLDADHRIIFMNDNALKISGLTSEDVVGKLAQDVAMRNDLMRLLVKDLFQKEESDKDKSPIKIYAHQKESYFKKELIPILITPTGESETKLFGNVILLQNITEYKELDFAKTNFVANISHELKTPISSIKMSVQLLENKQIGILNQEQQSLLNSINDDANRLLRITKELLNISEVESGTIQLNMVTLPLMEVVDYAINATKNSAEQKSIKINIDKQDEPPQILADSEKMAWVLTNLLSNAIRYSYDNSLITIKISVNEGLAKIAVTDTGQGIPQQYISKIFDRYFRIPGSRKEGTGLGLSISKELVEAQGGKIEVESDFAKGSTFTLSIPVVE